MRQIGVRDEAKLLDGVGKCGRQLCCTSWLREFTPVSIRMAKNQRLPLNPDEISGVCGRLLCCLSYEDAHYKEQNKKMPKLGSEVVTPQGMGRVRHVHPLKETVTVMLESSVLSEFAVADLISNKTSSGGSCSTCGGCTAKRRARAEEDNAKVRRQRASASAERRGQIGRQTCRQCRGVFGQKQTPTATPSTQSQVGQRRREQVVDMHTPDDTRPVRITKRERLALPLPLLFGSPLHPAVRLQPVR